MAGTLTSHSQKRYRSPSAAKTPPSAPTGKLSKLKSSLHLFGKFTNPFAHCTDDMNSARRYSLSALIHCFKSDDNKLIIPQTHDTNYEHTHYRQRATPQADISPQSLSKEPTILVDVTHLIPEKKKSLQSILLKHKTSFNDSALSIDEAPPPFRHQHRHTSSMQSAALPIPSSTPKVKVSRHARHYSHVSYISSSITINSEDLTAKEFADYTGIRILPEDETSSDTSESEKRCECDDEEDVPVLSSACKGHGRHKSCDTTTMHVNEDSQISMKSYCTMHSHDTRAFRKPQIWDSDFWRRPAVEGGNVAIHSADSRQLPTHARCSSIATTPPMLNLEHNSEPPILHTMRKLNTLSSETLGSDNVQINLSHSGPRNCILRKGRFEIHLETPADADDTMVSTRHPLENEPHDKSHDKPYELSEEAVVEWKRKQKSPLSQSSMP
ncbi:hypothetical protein BDF14DRAFT_1742691 [Spinellus fusiger]|nr:hypothetical protein BDF14DRAFT_1742691 [Spinellus fusiger]